MGNSCGLLEKNIVCVREERMASAENTGLHRSQGMPASRGQFEIDAVLENKLIALGMENALTKREREILKFVLAGNTNKEIAQKLYRTERTVEYHRNRMMRKLGTHTAVELVKRAIALGII